MPLIRIIIVYCFVFYFNFIKTSSGTTVKIKTLNIEKSAEDVSRDINVYIINVY